MNKRFLLIILLIFTVITNTIAESPKREWRSTWLATVSNIDWPHVKGTTPEIIAQQKQEMVDYLDGLAMMNMNAICFQVRSMCDAMYESSYEPWSSYLTGKRGTNPGWDPLAFVVDECHKRGIDCYAWVNPYRWTNSEKGWNTAYDNSLKEKGVLLKSGKYTYLNPGLPEVREHIVNVCKEIITKYEIQGLIFDDYFYPSAVPANETAGDYNLWKSYDGDLSFSDWRRANVDQMIKDVYNMVQEERPDLRFGVSPAGAAGRSTWKYGLPDAPFASSDWQYERIYSDPLSWLNSGTLDFISPQEYFHTDDSKKPFEPLTDWWDEMATHFGRHHYTSLSISCLLDDNSQTHWDEHVNQTLIARRLSRTGVFGLCFFSTKYLNGPSVTGAGEYFKEKLFSRPSLAPVLDWKKGVNYEPVKGLTLAEDKLTWEAVENGNAIIRYTVYAVPDSISYAEALTDDGLSNEYLLGVSFYPEYKLSVECVENHWYAVCVYDGYGRESRSALACYEGGTSQATELLAPTNGSVVEWDNRFSWTGVENAVYTLEIADDRDFKNLVFSRSDIKSSESIVDMGFTEENQEYYWRVISLQGRKSEAVSEPMMFISPTREKAQSAELLSPQEGANVGTNISFEWKGDKNTDKFTLEISLTKDFSDVIYKIETTDNKTEIPSAYINKGTRYWRIISEGKRVITSISDYHSFVVTELGIGDIEEGYEIKKDTYGYEDKNGVSVRNLWLRSVKDDFSNISFEEDGKMNRSFIAKDGYVYLAGRSEVADYAKVYLRKYNGSTGEFLGDLNVSNYTSGSIYPCNTVTKDSKGNVCLVNMSTSIDSIPICVNVVDLKTGYARCLCYLTFEEGGRADHVAVYGDVLSDKFYVFAAIKGTNKVVRWTVTNDTYISEMCILKNFYPTSVTALGTAPIVIPITENDIFVDGSTISLSRYDFATGELTESFAENKKLVPSKSSANGGTFFSLADKRYIAHAYNAHNSTNNKSNVQLVSINEQMDFSSMKALWTFPYEGLGDVSSGTLQVDADYEIIDEKKAVLYVYAPGNGLGAYEITDNAVSNVIDVVNEEEATTEYYDLQGMKVERLQRGIYIKRKGANVSKVMIKN